MFNKKRDKPRLGFPFSQPSNPPAISAPHQSGSSESYEEFLDRLEDLFNDDSPDAYFEAIESAPARWQRKPELMTSKAVGCFRLGDEEEGMRILNEVERVHPRYAPVYYYKALHFIKSLSPSRALRMIQKAHSAGTLDDEAESQMAEIETIARGLIQETAERMGVAYDVMERASLSNELAQEKLGEGEWKAAEQHAREALRLIPNWISPRNNRSFVMYYQGKTREAIAEAEKALSLESKNFHALKNLIIFHLGLNEVEQAQPYAEVLKNLVLSSLSDNSFEMDAALLVLGLLQDDQTLWAVAQKYFKRKVEELFDTSWYILGVAALRTGHAKEAEKLLEKTEEYYEPASDLLKEIATAMRLKKAPPVPSFYYPSLSLILPSTIIKELIEILSKDKGGGGIPPYIVKKLNAYLQDRPYVINGLLMMLPDPYASTGVPGILLALQRPDLDARLLEFALGKEGSDKARMNVLMAMAQEGRELPGPIRFWNEEMSEWRDVELHGQMLTDDVELNISDAAARWVRKSHETDDINEKIACLRKAVELDPQSGFAVHMLGALLMQSGKRDEGLSLARKAIEVDPDYMFAYANLALIEAQAETPDEGLIKEYIFKVSKAPMVTVQTSFVAHLAAMHLAYYKEDFEAARREYEIACQLRPDDPALEGWDRQLSLAEAFSGGWLQTLQAQSRARAHEKAMRTKLEKNTTAETTLNSLTRDALGSVARVWGIPAYGKKAELARNISVRMRNETAVKSVLNQLSAEEKAALRWVLENEGARSWQTFTEKYGNDLEESPYWNYHSPETNMGRLRQTGLLAKGTLENVQVLFIPADVRDMLRDLLGD